MNSKMRLRRANIKLSRWQIGLGTLACLCGSPATASGQGDVVSDVTKMDDVAAEEPAIVVTGRRARRIGTAQTASEGDVSGEDLRVRPLLRTSELAEAVPGLIAVQHSGGGKAAQYMIRGYNLDHGTDFSIAVDGQPYNLRSHTHGEGYLDLNGLIPETVASIAYRKGPYRASDGDFSAVASASLRTIDEFDRPFANLSTGTYGYRRLAGGGSFGLGSGTMLLATEVRANDGIWQLPERLRHAAGLAKYTVRTSGGTVRASLSLYDARWRPTEQNPERAFGTVLADRFGTLDPFLRGETGRMVFNVGYESEGLTATAYAQHYRFKLLSNFTFFLNDPVNGDELEQTERRHTLGGRVQQRLELGRGVTLTMGADAQTDRIRDLGLYQTRFGQRIATASLVDAFQTSAAGYVEAGWKASDRLSLLAGARIDAFRFKTVARAGAGNSGRVDDVIVTPKASANFVVTSGLALYANYGHGFHSNAIRGVTAPIQPTDPLSRIKTHEFGARFERGPLIASLTRWHSRSSSELVYSGDDGTVSPTGPSRRRGYEAVVNLRPARWLAIDAVYATNHARYRGAPGFDRVPNALESAGELGVAALFTSFDAALRVRHFGPRPLSEDNAVRAPSTTVVSARVAKRLGGVEVIGELLNLFDTRRADADYFYASRLPGEPLEGVEDVHSRAVEPRTFRLGAKLSF